MSIHSYLLKEIFVGLQNSRYDKRLFEKMSAVQMRASNSSAVTTPWLKISSIDTLQRTMTEFVYCPEEECTFERWFRRYEGLLEKDAVRLGDAPRSRLSLRKLSTPIYTRCVNHILLKSPKDVTFAGTVKQLIDISGFRIRFCY